MTRTPLPRPLSRRAFLGGATAGLFGWWAGAGCAPDRGRPNLLVLITDDQRWDTLGCMGNPVIQTPQLDLLAERGVLFRNSFVTTSICPTSRASIFTGQYLRRHGIADFEQPLSDAALAGTYPLLLRKAGYHTGFVGKWGLAERQPPPRAAFDDFRGFSGQGEYFQETDDGLQHLTGLLARDAIAFLRESRERTPFCLSVSFKAPHPPWPEFDPRFADRYRGEQPPVRATVNSRAAAAMPAIVRASRGARSALRWIDRPGPVAAIMRRYYRLITGADEAIGLILAELTRLGLETSTAVVFSSDNGVFLGEHGLYGKWLMYEEAIRVPLIVFDPRLSPARRGARNERMTLNVDIAPTLLDLAGAPAPASMQGRSLRPLLENEAAPWREDWFYEYPRIPGIDDIPACEGVRTERWKYIRYLDPEPVLEALYDLAEDPFEQRDLARDPTARATLEHLRERWRFYREELA